MFDTSTHTNTSTTNIHTCHILPPSEIDLGLCSLFLQAQKGNTYFTELAARVEYGNYVLTITSLQPPGGAGLLAAMGDLSIQSLVDYDIYIYIYIYIYVFIYIYIYIYICTYVHS